MKVEANLPYEKIARVLRTDKDIVRIVEEQLGRVTGKDNCLQRIIEKNEAIMKDRMDQLHVKEFNTHDIYNALIKKANKDDEKLSEHFWFTNFERETGASVLIGAAMDLAKVPKGLFLKREVAHEFFIKEPPPNMMAYFQLKNPEELLKKYDLFEVYSALRFVEDKTWLNNIFFKQLDGVTPNDFEERDIEIRVLHGEWLTVAEKFLKKKHHNVSHLKELGVIFIIPLPIDTSGETMRLFSLVLHYLHEVDFYSNLFRKYAKESASDFSLKVTSALRGDVLDERFSEGDRGKKWMIVQRYLAKDDLYDWRLFEPHVNPEAIHWTKAAQDIARLGGNHNELGLDFWKDLDFVGDYFTDEAGIEDIVSFNLIDTVMSLVKQKERVKYLYHHQESLWNQIFMEYFGNEETERLIIENFGKGYIMLD